MKKLLVGSVLAASLLTGIVQIPMISDVKSAQAWINLNDYKQYDSRWSSNIMVGSNTIGNAGCLMTAVANGLSGNAIGLPSGSIIDPANLNTWLKNNNGYDSNANLVWSAVTKINSNRISFQGRYYNGSDISVSTLRNYLDAGNKLILAQVNGGAHWVALSTHNMVDKFIVSDPGSTSTEFYYSSFTGYGIYTLTP